MKTESTSSKLIVVALLSGALACGMASAVSAATILFNDSFNTANSTDINANLARQTGTLAPASYTSNWLGAFSINSNTLTVSDTGNINMVSPATNFTSANNYSISVDYKPGTPAGSWANFMMGGAPNEWHFAMTGMEIFINNSGAGEIYGSVKSLSNGNDVGTFDNSSPDANGFWNIRYDVSTTGATILNGNATVSVYINNGLVCTSTNTAAFTQNHITLGTWSFTNAHWDNLLVTTTPVPEPATLALLMAGGLVLGRRSRRS